MGGWSSEAETKARIALYPGEARNPGEHRALSPAFGLTVRETDSTEVPDPEVDHPCRTRRSVPTKTPSRNASELAIASRAHDIEGSEDDNDMRGAGVERRYGFGTREKLCRVKPHERHRHATRPEGSGRA